MHLLSAHCKTFVLSISQTLRLQFLPLVHGMYKFDGFIRPMDFQTMPDIIWDMHPYGCMVERNLRPICKKEMDPQVKIQDLHTLLWHVIGDNDIWLRIWTPYSLINLFCICSLNMTFFSWKLVQNPSAHKRTSLKHGYEGCFAIWEQSIGNS